MVLFDKLTYVCVLEVSHQRNPPHKGPACPGPVANPYTVSSDINHFYLWIPLHDLHISIDHVVSLISSNGSFTFSVQRREYSESMNKQPDNFQYRVEVRARYCMFYPVE